MVKINRLRLKIISNPFCYSVEDICKNKCCIFYFMLMLSFASTTSIFALTYFYTGSNFSNWACTFANGRWIIVWYHVCYSIQTCARTRVEFKRIRLQLFYKKYTSMLNVLIIDCLSVCLYSAFTFNVYNAWHLRVKSNKSIRNIYLFIRR